VQLRSLCILFPPTLQLPYFFHYRLIVSVHDTDYRAGQKDFNSFLEALTQKVTEADGTVPELPIKDIVGRHIHRGGFWAIAGPAYQPYIVAHVVTMLGRCA
jgi:hypothetical protein